MSATPEALSLVVMGTRPEAIKLAPVVHRLRTISRFRTRLVLTGQHGIDLRPPMRYAPFVHFLARADLVLTDSGGIQEEAATLGVPTIVARGTAERVEALAAGRTELVGTDEDLIVARAAEHLARPCRSPALCLALIYGDGQASLRKVEFLSARLQGDDVRPDSR